MKKCILKWYLLKCTKINKYSMFVKIFIKEMICLSKAITLNIIFANARSKDLFNYFNYIYVSRNKVRNLK